MWTALAALIALIGVGVNAWYSSESAAETNAAQRHLQGESEEFTHNERIEQNEYEQQMHEFNLLNDPTLQVQGMVNAGMSRAGAVQAIVGSPSTGFTPTASNGSVGVPQAANQGFNSNMFSGLGDIMNSMFQNEKTLSDKKVNESTVEINKQYIDESNARIERLGVQNDMDRQQLDLTKELNASIIGKNEAERDLNIRRLDEISQNILESQARIDNLDAQTINEYIRSSLLIAETENIQADTSLKQAETGKVISETIGQNISNLDADIVLTFKKARLEASRILGCDVDAPLVTQYLEMCAFGRYDSMSALIAGKRIDSDNVLSSFERLGVNMKVNTWDRSKRFKGYLKGDYKPNSNQPSTLFTPSMQSSWNPY